MVENNKKGIENFFYEDEFMYGMDDLIEELEELEDIENLEDDWLITCEESTLEPIFQVDEKFVIHAITNKTDIWDYRFPDNDDDKIFSDIEDAIKQSIDIDKLNSLLPQIYYPSGKKFVINKNDIVEYCK